MMIILYFFLLQHERLDIFYTDAVFDATSEHFTLQI